MKDVMRINNIIWGVFAAGVMLSGLSSCGDFLELEPQNEIILEKFWNEKADVDGIIAGCYSGMQSDNLMLRMMIWGEFRSDNISRGQNLDKDLNIENVLKENILATNFYTTWDGFYSIINRCNTVIKYAPGVAKKDPNFSDSELKADIAEVTALRALCYFYLIRTFRDVPYSTEAFIDDNQKMDLPATKFDVVLDTLIGDLERVKDDAVEKYPEASSAQRLYQTGRITKMAIYAMLCEMYLWKKDYNNCIRYADLVIDRMKKQAKEANGGMVNDDYAKTNGYPLIPTDYNSSMSTYGYAYNQIFGTGNSSESIFELTFMPDDNMPSNGAVSLCYGNSKNSGIMGYASASSFIGDDMESKSFAVFNNKYDARAYENIMRGNVIIKYAHTLSQINFSSGTAEVTVIGFFPENKVKTNWIIYRLSDIMLLKAEALAQLISNNETFTEQDERYYNEAFALVNAVNKRSLCQPLSQIKDTLVASAYNTKEKIELLVMQERQRELMFEGKRWYDLVRRSLRDGNTNFLSTQVLQKFTSNTSAIQNKFRKLDAIFWPYNVDELKVNKNLHQNPTFGSGENNSYKNN